MDAPYETELMARPSVIRFRNRRVEQEYRQALSERNQSITRQMLLVGVLMLTAASALDFLFASPEFAVQATYTRAAWMIPPMLIAYGAWFFRCSHTLRQAAGIVVALAVGLGSLYIGHLAANMHEPIAPGGYLVIIVYTFFFLGLRFDLAIYTAATIIIAALLLSFVSGAPEQTLASNAYNMFALLVTCAIGAAQLEAVRRRDFLVGRATYYKAHVDSLTGLPNRRALDLHLAEVWAAERRNKGCLAVCLVDIDRFKDYNDRYGHQGGDKALAQVATTLKQNLLRPRDFIARYGGEEFAVVLPDINEASAIKVCDRLRNAIWRLNVPHQHSGKSNRVTISIGLAVHRPGNSSRSMTGILQAADEALYAAKVGGRNRVVNAVEPDDQKKTGIFKVPESGALARPAATAK